MSDTVETCCFCGQKFPSKEMHNAEPVVEKADAVKHATGKQYCLIALATSFMQCTVLKNFLFTTSQKFIKF